MTKAKKREVLIFILILAIASFFRLYKINQFAPGLYPDEAMNGNNAIQALETKNFQVFYPENNGREGLFINLQALSLKTFQRFAPPDMAYPIWSLRIVSAIIGILTVAGLYLLTKTLFNWQLAALSSFFLAVSFWHVNFSRIGFRAIMLPFILVYAFYFLWKGMKNNNLFDFAVAGIFGGLGFYTYISYRVAPLIAILLFLNYWWYLKSDFSISKYTYAKNKLLQGFALMALVTIVIALPIGIYFYKNSSTLLERSGASLFVFSQANPLKEFGLSLAKTLSMFNFSGDWNQRHNIPGSPMLSLPISLLFAIGFIHELIHWLKRKHGHFSSVHTLLIGWFFVMLLPGILSTEAPHAIRTIGVLPVVMIFAARGLWWVFQKMADWYHLNDPHSRHEAHVVLSLVMIVFLLSISVWEYNRYFNVWARDPQTAGAFNQNYVDLGKKINTMPRNVRKYVLVNTDGTLVNGIPMPAQTVMFITDTWTPAKQKAKNIYYLTQEQYDKGQYNKNSVVIPLEK